MREGTLLYIYDYQFKNLTSKNKFFLILKKTESGYAIISLPTSQDYIPSYEQLHHGCIDIDKAQQTTYCFVKDKIITDTGFCFEKNTFLYGHLIDSIDLNALKRRYPIEGIHFEIKGTLSDEELKAIYTCFKASDWVKNKFRKLF